MAEDTPLAGRACIDALSSAAAKLGMQTQELADRLSSGRIADVILELRALRHLLPHHSRERVENLLREVGVLSE
jgi:hypothetical protein